MTGLFLKCIFSGIGGPAQGQAAAQGLPRTAKPPAVRKAHRLSSPKQGAANALPGVVKRITSVEGITEYALPNGLKILLFPDPSKQTITVNITYLVGSRYEGYGETGMAHLLEHLLFKGSRRHKEINKELDLHGARPNGSTSFDRTNYYETFRATDANLEWALDLEADRMVNSFIARKDLDSEMTVVRNEYESGENSPIAVLLERTLSSAYLWHSYGKATIGARSDIEQVPISRLQAFYRTYYQPDNAVLLVAGRIDPARTLARIAQKFGSLPRPKRTLPHTYTIEPTQDGERSVTLRRVGDTQVVSAAYHIPAGAHPDFASFDVLTQILGDTPAGRLYKKLVETGKATSVSAGTNQLREPGTAVFVAEVRKEGELLAAREALLETVEGCASTPPTREEVERARRQLLKQIELNMTNSESIGLELSEWAAMGDWRLMFLYRDQLRKVNPESVQRVAAAYLKSSNRTVGLFYPTAKPDRAEIPKSPSLAAMLKGYRGGPPIALGEAFDPSPASIERRTIRTQTAGLKLALLPKKTRGRTVHAVLSLRFGDATSLMNRKQAGEMAAAMLMRGTTKHTRQQLQDEMDRLKARLSVSGDATEVTVSLETVRQNFPATLRLAAEILQAPAFLASEYELLKKEELAALEQQRSEPEAIASRALSRHLSPYPSGDPRYVGPLDEEIAETQRATRDDVVQFYREFYGASQGEMAAVGDFDAREIQALLQELFGDWKSPRPYARLVSLLREAPPLNESISTPDKANATFQAGLTLAIRDDMPEFPALVLADYMLGGGFLSSRLSERIREKEGLSYSVGSYFSADPQDPVGRFGGYAICAPQNVQRVETLFKEVLTQTLKEGFTASEIAAAKTGFLQSREVSRAQDAELVGRLARYRYLGRTLLWDIAFEKRIQALTSPQITAALRKFIDPSRLSILKVGDFRTAGTK